jgi:ATP-dependent protease ClpP protease subunit
MSGGTIVWLAGEKRYACQNTTFMFHTVSSGGGGGKLYENKIDVKESERIFDVMCGVYDIHSSHDTDWWKERLQFKDIYLTPSGVSDHGIEFELLKNKKIT